MNWMKCSKTDIAQTEDDLKHYTANQALVANLNSEIEELYEDMAGLKAVDLTKDRVQGGQGNHNTQDNISILIDEKQKRLKRAAAAVARVDRGLNILTDKERKVIEAAYINGRNSGRYVEKVCRAIHYSDRQVDNIRREALGKLTYTLYGIMEG